jgi:hypothetical protein
MLNPILMPRKWGSPVCPRFSPDTIPYVADCKVPGVVSLLGMLRFYAERFITLARSIETLHTEFRYSMNDAEANERIPEDVVPQGVTQIKLLRAECEAIALTSAADHVTRLLQALQDRATGREFVALMRELQNRIDDELGRKLIYCVETDRAEFCDPNWLLDSAIARNFPTAFKEIQSAGRCYAFGEAPASAFHSMRALEVALGTLAGYFHVDFQRTNWHPVIEAIESNIRDISNAPKTPAAF